MAVMSKTGEFCWNELATTDVKKAKDFYGKVFGWEFADQDMGDMTYTMVKHKGENVPAGIWGIPKDKQKEIPSHWLSYISVENLDKSLDKATKNGAKVVRPAFDVSDYGRMAIVADPTGAHIALWQSFRK